jgi:hypothetical protein
MRKAGRQGRLQDSVKVGIGRQPGVLGSEFLMGLKPKPFGVVYDVAVSVLSKQTFREFEF